ncbi:MAG: gamma-glutamyltransferase [Fodinibius sp.]|nr:gamma-glutamyltransferase [Fodinibius sp.]
MKKCFRLLYPTLILIISFLILPSQGDAQVGEAKTYEQGIVVTAEEHASQIGAQILQQGGNAVDAAVAVQFALAVTLPRAGNIGGGGFMVLHLQDGTTTTLDFREKAPLMASENMYIRDGEYISDLSREEPWLLVFRALLTE